LCLAEDSSLVNSCPVLPGLNNTLCQLAIHPGLCLHPITPLGNAELILTIFSAIKLSVLSTTPSPPPKHTLMKPKVIQTVDILPASPNIISPGLWTTPNNPRPNTNQATSITDIGILPAQPCFPYSNNFTLLDSLQPCADCSCTHCP